MVKIIKKDEEKKRKKKKCELSNNRLPPYRSDYLYLQPCLSSVHSCKVRYSCFFEFFLERDLRSVDNRLRMALSCRMGPSVRLS